MLERSVALSFIVSFCCIDNILGSDTDTFFHIKDGAVYGNSVEKGRREMFVLKEVFPFFEA